MLKVTEQSHPLLFEALVTLDHDCGKNIGRGAAVTEYIIPCMYDIDEAEAVLASLTDGERETLVIGEYCERMHISERGAEYGRLDQMLEAFFNDFCEA